jgi:hypothetical protein
MPATTDKPPALTRELAALDRMTATELRDKYAQVFGEPAASGNRAWLARRVGWRMQALAEGDLTDRARARATELARDADLRLTAPKERRAGRNLLLLVRVHPRPPGCVRRRPDVSPSPHLQPPVRLATGAVLRADLCPGAGRAVEPVGGLRVLRAGPPGRVRPARGHPRPAVARGAVLVRVGGRRRQAAARRLHLPPSGPGGPGRAAGRSERPVVPTGRAAAATGRPPRRRECLPNVVGRSPRHRGRDGPSVQGRADGTARGSEGGRRIGPLVGVR